MAWRFNAPPGWPVPSTFIPPAGWVPDPSWPPAPEDWAFWWDDAVPPTSAGSTWSQPVGADPYVMAPAMGAPDAGVAKRGLPGWAIALIVLGILGVLTVVALIVAVAVAIGPRLEEWAAEFDESAAQFSASQACDISGEAYLRSSRTPDPIQARFQSRLLTEAELEAASAADVDASYSSLRDDIATASEAAADLAALPVDVTSWSPAQERAATQAQDELASSGAAIADRCLSISDPWDFEGDGPSV